MDNSRRAADPLRRGLTQIKGPKKTLSNKEKKKKDRLRAARKKAGEEVSDSEEEDW